MGIFRTKKASRYTVEECLEEERKSKMRMKKILAIVDRVSCDEMMAVLESELFTWAEWRECRARLEGKNESDVV